MNIKDYSHIAAGLAKALARHVNPERLDQNDEELVRQGGPVVLESLRRYFRMEIRGLERVPPGPVLLVCNHEAGITWLQVLAMGAVLKQAFPEESLRALAHDMMFWIPGVREFLVTCGAVRATPANALELLRRGSKVIVAPGGDIEAFRPYSQRYEVTLGGRRGFARLALKAKVPVCPVLFTGGHETFFVLTSGRWLNKALQVKRFVRSNVVPIYAGLPWGLAPGFLPHLPLPSKSTIEFLPPISLDEFTPEDSGRPEVVESLFQRVLDALQQAMDRTVAARKWPILG